MEPLDQLLINRAQQAQPIDIGSILASLKAMIPRVGSQRAPSIGAATPGTALPPKPMPSMSAAAPGTALPPRPLGISAAQPGTGLPPSMPALPSAPPLAKNAPLPVPGMPFSMGQGGLPPAKPGSPVGLPVKPVRTRPFVPTGPATPIPEELIGSAPDLQGVMGTQTVDQSPDLMTARMSPIGTLMSGVSPQTQIPEPSGNRFANFFRSLVGR